MPRIRTIKPEQPKDEELAMLPISTRYLFAFLPTLADREGRLEDRPRYIKLEIFPWDDGVEVDAMLNALHPKFIIRYEVEGKRYIQIRTFLKHQIPHHRESPSKIPPPVLGAYIDSTQSLVQAQGQPMPSPLDKGKGREGKGKEGACAPFHGPALDSMAFETLWTIYPRKDARADAVAAFKEICPPTDLLVKMKRAVEAKLPEWRNLETRYIPLLATWLAKRRWEDFDGLPSVRSKTPKAEVFMCADCGKKEPHGTSYYCEDCNERN